LRWGVKEDGNTNELLKLAYDHIISLKVELLIIDETQHLKTAKERGKFAELQKGETALTNTLKTMLIRGVCPMVFIGITEARSLIFNDEQLADRSLEEIDFSNLDITSTTDREIFINYCGMLGLKLKRHGLFAKETNLLGGDIPACLYAVSNGRIGIVSRVVEHAAVIAIDKGSPCVLRSHLEGAVDQWALPKKVIDYNPFKIGVREARLK
jgi:Bacterial TniB protein